MDFASFLARCESARDAANDVLSIHESSPARVVELKQSFAKLAGLPVDVEKYYQEALEALQVKCFRAAMVFGWAGFVYTVAAKLVQGYQPELKIHYSKWNYSTVENLFDSAPEAQILEAAKKCGLIGSQELHIYKGWLSTRNKCAHPTLYTPSRNIALGFVDSVLTEVPKYT